MHAFADNTHSRCCWVQLEFLDTCLNYGQGLILLLVFGLGDDLAAPLYKMVGAVVKFMRRLMFGVEDIPSATAFAPTRNTKQEEWRAEWGTHTPL